MGRFGLNIVFDLGGIVFTWDPDSLIARVFREPEVRAKVLAEVLLHRDWLELDRGTVSPEEFARRTAARTDLRGLTSSLSTTRRSIYKLRHNSASRR